MKKFISISLLSLTTLLSNYAMAENFDGLTCEGKRTAIQTQLDYAKQNNNIYRVQGLEKALSDVNIYCSNGDLERKYKDKVQDKLDDLQEKQQELQEAQYKGRLDKINKIERKVEKAKYELNEAQNNLNRFYESQKNN